MRASMLGALLAIAAGSCSGEGAEDTLEAALRPPPGEAGTFPAVCWHERTAALERLSAVRNSYLDCTLDADCVLVDLSSGCDVTCAAPVNRHGWTVVQRAVLEVEHAYCADYAARGCPPSIAVCARTTVACQSKRCAAVLPRFGEGAGPS